MKETEKKTESNAKSWFLGRKAGAPEKMTQRRTYRTSSGIQGPSQQTRQKGQHMKTLCHHADSWEEMDEVPPLKYELELLLSTCSCTLFRNITVPGLYWIYLYICFIYMCVHVCECVRVHACVSTCVCVSGIYMKAPMRARPGYQIP